MVISPASWPRPSLAGFFAGAFFAADFFVATFFATAFLAVDFLPAGPLAGAFFFADFAAADFFVASSSTSRYSPYPSLSVGGPAGWGRIVVCYSRSQRTGTIPAQWCNAWRHRRCDVSSARTLRSPRLFPARQSIWNGGAAHYDCELPSTGPPLL